MSEEHDEFPICSAYVNAWVDWLLQEEAPRLMSAIVCESAAVHVQPFINEILEDQA